MADALRRHRDRADGHQLDRVLQRVQRSATPPRRRAGRLRLRTVMSVMAVFFALTATAYACTSGGGSGGWVSWGDDGESAAGSVYCPPSGSGWNQTYNQTQGQGCFPQGEGEWSATTNSTQQYGCCPSTQAGWSAAYSGQQLAQCCPSQETGWSQTQTGTGSSQCCPSAQIGWTAVYNGTQEKGCCPHSSNTVSLTGGSTQQGCSPPQTDIDWKWHYGTSGSSWAWSSTYSTTWGTNWSSNQDTMEGSLALYPGTTLNIGYAVSSPSNTAPIYFNVTKAQVVFKVQCATGTPTASSFTATLPGYTYSFQDSSWYSTSSQVQGSIQIPDLCRGGKVLLNQGGTFSATPA